MNRFRTFATAALLLVLGGCAGAPVQPDWVTGNSQAYPQTRYLLGRGQGNTPALARDRARADLAKNFRVSVAEESEDLVTRSSRVEGTAAAGEQLEARASRRVFTSTDQVVAGARVAEAWSDPKSGAHHALAVLDRLQAAAGLRQEAARADARTRAFLEAARASEDPLTKIAAADRAVAAQRERLELQDLLAVVDPAGGAAPAPFDLAALEADRATLLQRVRVAARVSEDPLGGLQGAVAAGLAAAGFLAAEWEGAPYLLDASLGVTEHSGAEGWQWVRGTLQVTLRERAGPVRGSHRWEVKASAQQAELARRRAADQVAELLRSELGPVIVGFGGPEAP